MSVPLPFEGESFDAVFSTQVIHHARLVIVRRTIEQIFRILKPEGIAFIAVSAYEDDLDDIEIEPNTYVPRIGAEKGVLQHIFTEGEMSNYFQLFDILEILLRAEGKVLSVLAKKA